ncbi:MAG TPA: glucose 1-dehydrogenase [Acidobacteriota bacterium]|jgi:glucose 1-dehydrogenase|nr:glucose 1-dehydrogenase [Acidobacteriota bacterium]
MRLKGRAAIVTGAARGIGRAIALGIAREGASVVVNDCRTDGSTEEVASAICAAGGKAVAVVFDIRQLEGQERLVSVALDQFTALHILVNNAGVEFREPFLEAQPQTWDWTLAVNLKAPYFLSQKAARAMMRSGGGKIINIASVHDHVPLRERSIYAVSKGGMAMLTKALALELAEHRINVNAISPGAILTDMNRESLSKPENLNRVLGKIALKRIGRAEDVVGAAVFLASSESDYVTGATLYVDGGMLLY